MGSPSISRVSITKIKAGIAHPETDALAIEEPLQISIKKGNATEPVSVTMRTPGNDEELASGLLITEGIIGHTAVITDFETPAADERNHITVILDENTTPDLRNTSRNSYSSSACGVCGKTTIDSIEINSPFIPLPEGPLIPHEVLIELPRTLRQHQSLFDSTGGLHAAALFNSSGEIRMLREDIGRHNALDKLIGASFLEKSLPLRNCILLLSGRAGFELIQKAAMAGIPVVAAVGAPSSLAVSLAKSAGITLVGFLREDRFNIYSHEERIYCSS
jgi:FdhD protein